MTVTFPHAHGCPTCETTCDDVQALHDELTTLRWLVLGALWVAAASTRPIRSEVESLDALRDLAGEGVRMSGVLAPDADVLALVFGADR
jgi:hypothetical protein